MAYEQIAVNRRQLGLDRDGPVGFDDLFEDGEMLPPQRGER
jgi:hypothetical protein